MKNIFKLCCSFLIAGALFSCKKNVSMITYENGTAPVLTGSKTAVTLEPGKESQTAIVLSWTNPAYTFSTGLSSQDVSYTLEIDTLGGNFGSGVKYTTVIARDLSLTYTVGDLNAILGNTMKLQLEPRRNFNLQARITSSMGNPGAAKLTSNIISFSASPFPPPPKVELPGAGTLWITGSAVGSGWSNPLGAPYVTSQKFTKLSNTKYELIVPMIPGGGYKIIQENGDWSKQYSFVPGSGDALAGSFEKKDATQFDAPAVAGSYKLTFDFQFGTFTAVKQ